MKLQDALGIARKQFISRVQAIIEDMKQLNQEYIQNVLNEVVAFNEKFRQDAIVEHERFFAYASQLNDDDLAKESEGNKEYVQALLFDWSEQETLVTTLETFKETTENRISHFESVINSGITKDWKDNEMRIVLDQHTRNREIIQEIVANTKFFLDCNHRKFITWREQDEADQ